MKIMISRWPAFCLAAAVTVSAGLQVAYAEAPPSVFGVDAPELARPGAFAVGVRTLPLVERNQLDVLAVDPKTHGFARHDRNLTVDLWYPATPPVPGTPTETYVGNLPSEPPAEPARFSVPGVAVRNAPPAGGGYPLVIVSHGYSNATVAMTWLKRHLRLTFLP
jgi:hypothetical protein